MELPISTKITVQCRMCYTFFNVTNIEVHLCYEKDNIICPSCQRKIDEDNKRFLDSLKKRGN